MSRSQTIRRCDATCEAAVTPAADRHETPYLIVTNGNLPGAPVRLDAGVTRVGRARDNTLVLSCRDVSRHHATVCVDREGRVLLTDLSSTNGTWCNGVRLAPQSPLELHPGDQVRFGPTMEVRFTLLDAGEVELQQSLYERLVTNSLTGLHNRAYFLDRLGPMSDLSSEQGLGTAVLMIDIDHFKRVNDTYGHEAGDTALRHMAAVLREATRRDDMPARYGGDEFVVALAVPAAEQATVVAERIRHDLSASEVTTGHNRFRLTASLGVTFQAAGELLEPEQLVAAADHCLYRAKASGRDRIVSAPSHEPGLT